MLAGPFSDLSKRLQSCHLLGWARVNAKYFASTPLVASTGQAAIEAAQRTHSAD